MLNRGWAPLQGVVAGQEKYIDLPKPELYDLAADPKEESNLVDRRADRRRVLDARLRDFHAAPPGDRFAESPEVAAKLQSLGYTSGSAPRKAKYTEEDDPKNLMELDRWIQQGIEAWQHGRRGEALQIYERIIQRRPSMAIGYRNLAFLQWQNGDAREAIADAGARLPRGRDRARHDDSAGVVPGRGRTAGRRDRAARAAGRADAGGSGRAERARHRLRARRPERAGGGCLPARARREPVERSGAREHRHARDAAGQPDWRAAALEQAVAIDPALRPRP